MVFNSLHFVAFFAVVYPLYRLLPHRAQNWMLVGASYYFYAAWDWRFLLLLIGSTVIDFSMARVIGKTTNVARRRLALIVSLVYNLGVLGFFKYFNFFAGNFVALLDAVGWHVDPFTVNVILPMGISFYTFMTISYVIDVYRGEIQPTDNLLDFALFVAYFPHLVAGPVLRASLLLPQIVKPRTITRQQIMEGLWLIAWGYFQKMFVADNLAQLVNTVVDPAASPHGIDALFGIYAFAVQIYCDFAGYSNIARGLSKLMGIELNVNFLFPYLVLSPREFWKNWHLSLSTWLRDYLYIPLGGNRGSRFKTYRNLMITFVLGGLWHGAAWTFVVWGAYQGLALVVDRVVRNVGRRWRIAVPEGLNWQSLMLGLFMFQVSAFGMIMIRVRSVHQVFSLTTQVFRDFHMSPNTVQSLILPFLWIVAPLMIVHVYQKVKGSELAVFDLRLPVRYALYGAVFFLILLFGDFQGAQFIYFQF